MNMLLLILVAVAIIGGTAWNVYVDEKRIKEEEEKRNGGKK